MKLKRFSMSLVVLVLLSLMVNPKVNQANLGQSRLPQKCISVPTAQALDWSSDGELLAVLFAEGVSVFDSALEQQYLLEDLMAAIYFDGTFWVTDIKWHPTEPYLVTGAREDWELPRIWDVKNELIIVDLYNLGPSTQISVFDYSPDGSKLAVAHDTNSPLMGTVWELTVYDLPQQLGSLQSNADVSWKHFPFTFSKINSIDWSPDGTQLLIAKESGLIEIYAVEDPEFPHVYEGHRGSVNQAIWYNSNLFYSVGNDASVIRWLPNQSRPDELNIGSHNVRVTAIDVNNEYIITGDQAGIIFISGEGTLIELDYHEGASINDLAISPDQSILATVSDDGQVCIWDIKDFNS